MSILKIHAREIFDSRGNPTVEVDLYTKKGTVGYYIWLLFMFFMSLEIVVNDATTSEVITEDDDK